MIHAHRAIDVDVGVSLFDIREYLRDPTMMKSNGHVADWSLSLNRAGRKDAMGHLVMIYRHDQLNHVVSTPLARRRAA
jgi:hypothetical protein